MRRVSVAVALLAVCFSGCNCGVTPIIGDDGGTGGGGGGTGMGGGAGGGGGATTCSAPVSCYSGPAGTSGVGACLAGTAQCLDGGVPGQCVGELLPSTEACNGVDDDCNGTVDDPTVLGMISCGLGACRVTTAACSNGAPATCTPGAPSAELCGDSLDNNCDGVVDEGCDCAHVAPSGADTNPGTIALPVLTINAGIAVALDAGFTQVCVASGPACPSNANFPEAITMVNGISVLGGYSSTPSVAADGGVSWQRSGTCVTRITNQDARGVYFGSSVTAVTALDGFTVSSSNMPANAGVTIEGSTGAVISNDQITGGQGQSSVGVAVLGGATPLIARSGITGGNGTTSAIGVHSTSSRPTISDNCNMFGPTGRCTQGCFNATRFIRGRPQAGTPGASSYAIRLEDSPGAVVERTATCSGAGTGDVAGVRLSGDGAGTVLRASILEAFGGGTNAVGVWADACANASPWIFDNHLVSGNSPVMGARADGVRAIGDCHVRVDSNVRIVGGQESSNNDAIGVYCARDAASGISSRCTVQNNTLIQGAGAGFPPRSTGVQCDVGACRLVEKNVITPRTGIRTFGVVLNGAGTVVRKNDIEAGCATQEGIGLLAIDSFARVENNQLRGSLCAGAMGPMFSPTSTAVKVLVGSGTSELDLHSNSVAPFGGRGAACVSRALTFDVVDGGTPSGPSGQVRNNVLHAGFCASARPVEELSAAADPRVFENNDLFTPDGGLYLDEGATVLPDVTAVNMLAGAAANIAADPQYDGGVHLGPGSPCRNAGTASGAPVDDFDGNSRPQEGAHDIGADEFVP